MFGIYIYKLQKTNKELGWDIDISLGYPGFQKISFHGICVQGICVEL